MNLYALDVLIHVKLLLLIQRYACQMFSFARFGISPLIFAKAGIGWNFTRFMY